MSANVAPDATALVMDSAPGYASLLEAVGTTTLAGRVNAWTNADRGYRPATEATHAQLVAGTFDNRPTWDNWKNK
ncbi:hypothetical protein [Streptomyces microflavus]|uniref:hypothetical protein n=1 Tax=Streptomyces microflavus TaxID=1919 RepID=UPI003822DC43